MPIFVDLNNETATYSDYQFPSDRSSHLITDAGELWTWDQSSKKIFKVSKTNITMMGFLQGSISTKLLHVDKNGHLYFVQ